jgi:glycine cleavage system transcriptional repressor
MADGALLTAVGKDRPGIVAAVSGVLFQSDCNIEDSTMARLGGDFAIMLMLRLPAGLGCQELSRRMEPIRQQFSLSLQLRPMPQPEPAGRSAETAKHLIYVYGADRKGIVAKLTGHLASRQVNITNLTTHVVPHEKPLYVMLIEVELPAAVDAGQLGEQLGELGRQIDVQVTVRPKDDARF